MFQTFRVYYSPVINYLEQVAVIARENTMLSILATLLITIYQLALKVWEIEIFGVSNVLILLVSVTVFWNTYTGVKKSEAKAKRALVCLRKMGWENQGTDKYRKCKQIYLDNRFDKKKLNFVFFKMFTFLAYLFFAKTLLGTDADNFWEGIISMGSGLILKLPTAWFWYSEFKSIGENSIIIYGKRPKIFEITENIFEAKILKFMKDE